MPEPHPVPEPCLMHEVHLLPELYGCLGNLWYPSDILPLKNMDVQTVC